LTRTEFEGAELKLAVRAHCQKEFKRVTYEPWDPKRYPDWSTLEQTYEAKKRVAQQCASVRRLLDELQTMDQVVPPLAEWAARGAQRLAELVPDVPRTLLGFAVQQLELTPIPSEVPKDRRDRAAKRAPPAVYWRSGPGRYREPTNRELAFMTLLLGHWPDIQPGARTSPEEVVRQEANAVASALRRRRKNSRR
jgi:hypothetical protein